MILAIDSSIGTAVALVTEGGAVVAESASQSTRGHAESIGTLISEVLEGCEPDSPGITSVAVGMGPGPFTGLRVGIAAAKVFALAREIPLLPVASHDALAWADGLESPLLITADAKRQEKYWSAYSGRGKDGLPLRIFGPALNRTEEIAALAAALPGFGGRQPRHLAASGVSAVAVGQLAALRLSLRIGFEAAVPLYLRSADVTLAGAPKRVTA